MKTSGIYKIQSIAKPERIYIGSAVNIGHRWNCHLSDLRKSKHHSTKLQRHYNKYGESDLQFSIVFRCKEKYLLEIEQQFIDSHNPYFNECKIAGNCLGIKRSEEARRNMSKAHQGVKLSVEHIMSRAKAQTGLKRSEEVKQKWRHPHNMTEEGRNVLKNRTFSHEYIEKLKISYRGENNPNFGNTADKRSPEWRKKQSDAVKRGWEKRKLKNII